ncbi:type II toxin-antitoxin system RatA family toxin [Kiloniella laminariae]|uniref:Type II toxin-antitoxin system RatA family toxin n=1 Tax=Kiloniella laminariae TaxID=454162 RepID=A0ABT4LLS0_9PROT|nr:type II toxin-antitoxin system RatA family toxin [Kiloniella laminariae]MCZ4282065.1 type II toxin-antitoxin system RatA family toxin [Kiloniella laminariae]
MPVHEEKKVLTFLPEQIFEMVADVERYPDFLPWCVASRIKRRQEKRIIADLVIGFKMIREKFTSQVDLNREELRIEVTYLDGPFKYLTNTWIFETHPEGCLVDFHVDFEFKSKMLQILMEPLFHEAVRRMVHAFETRAAVLFTPCDKTATLKI